MADVDSDQPWCLRIKIFLGDIRHGKLLCHFARCLVCRVDNLLAGSLMLLLLHKLVAGSLHLIDLGLGSFLRTQAGYFFERTGKQ